MTRAWIHRSVLAVLSGPLYLSMWFGRVPMVCAMRTDAGASYWAGHLTVVEFNYARNEVEKPARGEGKEFESVGLTVYTFEVYQNPQGVVRHQLSSMSRNRGLEPGLDVQLLDYAAGYMVSFNKGARVAFKTAMPLPGGTAQPLQARELLGHRCRGVETRWKDINHNSMRTESWTSTDSNFHDPLLKITTISDLSGHLGMIRMEAITELRKAGHLDESLFQIPPKLEVKPLR
jgi:hypothetical protein